MNKTYYEKLVRVFYSNAITIFKDNPTHDNEEPYAHKDIFVKSIMAKHMRINAHLVSHILNIPDSSKKLYNLRDGFVENDL